MIIALYSRIKIDRVLEYAHWVLAGCAALLAGWLGSCYFLSSEKEMISSGPSESLVQEISYDAIGSGPLLLYQRRLPPLFAYLVEELQVAGKNTRPDVPVEKAPILMRLKSTGQEEVIFSGEKLFLQYSGEDEKAPRFTHAATPLWTRVSALSNNALLLEMGQEEEVKAQITVQASSSLAKKAMGLLLAEEEGYVKVLKEAKWWGKDLLLQHYAKKEYTSLAEKQKLELDGYVIFAASGDYLSFHDGKWKEISLAEASHDAPLARVKAISGQMLDVVVWDASGFKEQEVKLQLQRPQKLTLKMEQMPSSLRLRTSSQITCLLGRRRLILKEGDWLMKTATGWHILRTVEQMEESLQHKIRGELFIFDSLERDEKRVALKGHLFDEMRTQMQDVMLPIISEKKKTHKRKKHLK